MRVFRFLTAGESHGRALVAIVEGVPAGLRLSAADLVRDLGRRQLGYGRGQRMAIERDAAEILSGVRHGETIGSPIALLIQNRDWTNWQHTMSVEADPPADAGCRRAAVTRPRPGHADLSAGLKYGRTDLRDVLERASARETAARVAVGAIAKRTAPPGRHRNRAVTSSNWAAFALHLLRTGDVRVHRGPAGRRRRPLRGRGASPRP